MSAITKEKYIAAIVENGGNQFKAALTFFADDEVGKALVLYNKYKDDDAFLKELSIATREHKESDTPNKYQVLMRLWHLSGDPSHKADERIKALKLYAELKGMLTIEDVIQNIKPSVLVVKDTNTQSEWEIKAIEQQKKLLGLR